MTTLKKPSSSQKVRAQLKHPVIDSDGHTIELGPVLMDYVREIGGAGMVDRLNKASPYGNWWRMTPEERRANAAWCPMWWVPTGQTLDYATGALPKLLYERMDELGMDFSVLYPTSGLGWVRMPHDDELRQVICRAINTYFADIYREYSDRMTPAACILTGSPREAIAELEHAVKVLGLKAAMISAYAHRRAPWVDPAKASPDGFGDRLDILALDSDYDYDPFWAKCVELGVAPTTHTGSQGWGFRRTSIYMYNHIGHFAATSEALCKALFFSGVTKRFPTLKFGFLECGVGWACSLYADLVGHWEKRGGKAIGRLDPAGMDRDLLVQLASRYGNHRVRGKADSLRRWWEQRPPSPDNLDDFAACGIEKAEDIRDLFVPHFFFGCEADDPINSWAFNEKVNPFGARLNIVFSSDISHWDVPDMRETVEEAYELVEKGLMSEKDFRDFVFANPVKLYAGMNPDFFKSTRVEADAARALAQTRG